MALAANVTKGACDGYAEYQTDKKKPPLPQIGEAYKTRPEDENSSMLRSPGICNGIEIPFEAFANSSIFSH